MRYKKKDLIQIWVSKKTRKRLKVLAGKENKSMIEVLEEKVAVNQ